MADQEPHFTEHTRNSTDEKQQGSDNPGSESASSRGEHHAPESEKPDADSKHWLEYLTAGFAFIAALATGAAAAFTGWQAWIAKDTETRQLRAYISAAPVQIIKTPEGNWAIQVAAHNYGQTPARSVQINGGWELLGFPKGKEVVAARHFAYIRSEESSGPDVYPTKDGTTTLPPFSPDDMKEMQGYAGPLKLYGAGVVTYEDVFGNLQHTNYCFILKLRDIGTLVAVGKPGEITSFDWCVTRYNHAT